MSGAPAAVSRCALRQQENIFAVGVNSGKFITQDGFAMAHGWFCKHSACKRSFIRRQGWTAMLWLYLDRTVGRHRHHCHPCRVAAASAEQGKGAGRKRRVSEQPAPTPDLLAPL